MIVCNVPEQVIYERVKTIIREDMNASDFKAGDVAIKIIKYLKADMYGDAQTYKLA